MSKQAKWTPLERHNAQCGTDFCQLHKAAPQMAEALRPFATVPCERRGNIHCTMLPSDSGVKVCAPCAARAALRAAWVES